MPYILIFIRCCRTWLPQQHTTETRSGETTLMWAHNSSENHMERDVTGDSPSDWEDVLSKETCPGRDTTQYVIGDTGDVINVFNVQVSR